MEYLAEYGLFLAKAITIVAALLIAVGGIVAIVGRQRRPGKAKLVVEHLNKRYEDMTKAISSALANDSEMRQIEKSEHKKKKAEAKQAKKDAKAKVESPEKRRVFVLDFDGDIQASAVKSIREEISALLSSATSNDEVVVRLESAGGLVHSYGLAASQLSRIREAGVPLTVAVDKVAASGGYMMACVGNQIIAAPFALIGSVGVIAQIPNLHRLLKKHNVDFEQITAGEYKRTLTIFGENTEKGRKKMREEIEETHGHFKNFIRKQRPNLDVEQIATGEVWLGTRALELGLVDRLQTSDDYLMAASKNAEVLHLSMKPEKNVMKTLMKGMSASFRGRSLADEAVKNSQPQIYV
jgi:serine protease SohB